MAKEMASRHMKDEPDRNRSFRRRNAYCAPKVQLNRSVGVNPRKGLVASGSRARQALSASSIFPFEDGDP